MNHHSTNMPAMLRLLAFIAALIAVIPQPALAAPEPTICGCGSAGGVCYLMTYTGGTPIPDQQAICQDIPVSGLQSGMYTISARVRSQAGLGAMKLALQQLDSDGGCTVEIMAVKDVGEIYSNDGVESAYSGPTDNSANAALVPSSTLIAARGPVTLRPNATFLRFLLLHQTANTVDVVDANVSRTGPITSEL